MRQINFALIALAAVLAGGCADADERLAALMLGRQVSVFMEDGVMPINRKLIYNMVEALDLQGYDPDNASSNEDDEYIALLKREVQHEYDREWRVAESYCDLAYEKEFSRAAKDHSGLLLLPAKNAGKVKDACLFHRGWEAGSQRIFDEILDLAWKKKTRATGG